MQEAKIPLGESYMATMCEPIDEKLGEAWYERDAIRVRHALQEIGFVWEWKENGAADWEGDVLYKLSSTPGKLIS